METHLMRRDAWRAINALYNRMLHNRSLVASTVIHDDDLDPAALVWLEFSLGFVGALDAETGDPVGLERALSPRPRPPHIIQAGATGVRLALTPAGVGWWHQNPPQRVLRAARARPRATVQRLLGHAGAAPEVVLALVEDGLVTVVDTAGGAEVWRHRLSPALLRSAPPAWRVIVLATGLRVLAIPEAA
jgi:hypothetical protein